MKGRVIAVETRGDGATLGMVAALMIDGRLEDLFLVPSAESYLPSVGEICMVEVARTLPNGRGAFCSLGPLGDGFLKDARARKVGDRFIAQVANLPEPGKAVTLSSRLLFKGPRLILTPGAPGINVSRRIGNAVERERLQIAASYALDTAGPDQENLGIIVRSAARNEPDRVLQREIQWLLAQFNATTRSSTVAPLGCLPGEQPFPAALADWFAPLPDEILCDARQYEALMARSSAASSAVEPSSVGLWGDERLLGRLSKNSAPLDAAGASDQIERLRNSEALLDPGSIFIEPTRALVSIDVNTGADFSPAATLKANLAAARELPRQLRLRGLGGQIVVDFAPMPKQHRRTLENALKKAFRDDPVETILVGWTSLGHFELQRKRERRPITELNPI